MTSRISSQTHSVRRAALEVLLEFEDNAADYARGRVSAALEGGNPDVARFWFDVCILIINILKGIE